MYQSQKIIPNVEGNHKAVSQTKHFIDNQSVMHTNGWPVDHLVDVDITEIGCFPVGQQRTCFAILTVRLGFMTISLVLEAPREISQKVCQLSDPLLPYPAALNIEAEQNGRQFPDEICICIFLNENIRISL